MVLNENNQKFYFLTESEANVFRALCESIVPAGENPAEDPGALTVGALSYIDSILSESPAGAQQFFRYSLAALDEISQRSFSKSFPNLSQADRDLAFRDLYLDRATREGMFALRAVILEGFYSDYHDPSYRGMTAWESIGFGGKRITDLKKDWSFVRAWREARAMTNKSNEEAEV